MVLLENQIENLNILHDLSAFLFHLGSTYHKSQTLLCSCFSAHNTQDKSVLNTWSVFTVNVKRQLLLGLIMVTGYQCRAKPWDSYERSKVQLNGIQLSSPDLPCSSSISITECYKMSLFLLWNQLYPAYIHGIRWARTQGIQCPAQSCNGIHHKEVKTRQRKKHNFLNHLFGAPKNHCKSSHHVFSVLYGLLDVVSLIYKNIQEDTF